MLSIKKTLIASALISGVFFSFSQSEKNDLAIVKKVVIDAGHGGKDPGTGYGKEKRYALDIALRVGRKIEKSFKDVEVIYTRKTDVFIPLHERAEIANKAMADLFISIHCNAARSRSAYGTETYIMGLHKTEANLELAKRENNVILMEDNYKKSYKGFDPNSPLAHIMLANFQSAFMHQSMDFAMHVEKEFAKNGNKSRGVKQAGFLVIWETTMPSVLIETGYLSNSDEARKLGTEEGRENIATSIFNAFYTYKGNLEGNQ
ncbi:N-acetylmuramoyl-L-alanine amidase [Marinilongibacter aquaticus]|uniref:N-acetylmuramoyl-L-alanine amidase family protein n=1 Tax=Marinilongibacter aquaticus TaxID=2975157 RepID=UPI0021BDF02D|nr:N-acetylmuramoyl-L-alanine amidase [Marinilongibacter aquaticus]UBM58062.1 N-acetylmuramoyl-L-alanine amidase [Marinilongibacter aquaticus]